MPSSSKLGVGWPGIAGFEFELDFLGGLGSSCSIGLREARLLLLLLMIFQKNNKKQQPSRG
jgi:hypothetical protein